MSPQSMEHRKNLLFDLASQKLRCENPISDVNQVPDRRQVVLVLKGAGTVIADPSGRVFLNNTGNPGMATGGSGDVLTGLAAAVFRAPLSPLLAACLAVYWHGLAGARLAASYPRRGNLASEIADMLPRACTE